MAGDYLMGDPFTPPDAYLFVMLRWCEKMGVDLSHLPRIAAFRARMQARPGVIQALKEEGLSSDERTGVGHACAAMLRPRLGAARSAAARVTAAIAWRDIFRYRSVLGPDAGSASRCSRRPMPPCPSPAPIAGRW